MSSWFRKGGAGADASGAGGATPGAGAPRDAVRALQDEFTTGISSADASPERLAALLMRIVEGLRGRSHDRCVLQIRQLPCARGVPLWQCERGHG